MKKTSHSCRPERQEGKKKGAWNNSRLTSLLAQRLRYSATEKEEEGENLRHAHVYSSATVSTDSKARDGASGLRLCRLSLSFLCFLSLSLSILLFSLPPLLSLSLQECRNPTLRFDRPRGREEGGGGGIYRPPAKISSSTGRVHRYASIKRIPSSEFSRKIPRTSRFRAELRLRRVLETPETKRADGEMMILAASRATFLRETRMNSWMIASSALPFLFSCGSI